MNEMLHSARAVAYFTGATLRQLQYWDEKGILRAKRSGRLRRYTDRQARDAARLVMLAKCGVHGKFAAPLLRLKYRRVTGSGALVSLDWEKARLISKPTVKDGILLIPKEPTR